MTKLRLDLLVVERGLAGSRTQAQAMIMAGEVLSEGRVLDKAGQMVAADLPLELKSRPRYVSRAGDKLASVADQFGLDFAGKVVLDVGSSTGGFTDFALQHGAARVYAVDVGTGQMDWRLRHDDRVVVMEQTDIRNVTTAHASTYSVCPELVEGPVASAPNEFLGKPEYDAHKVLPEPADIAVIDVSFISLTKVLEAVAGLVKPGAPIAAMMKPQFEAGRVLADRFHGVIDDPSVRRQLIQGFRERLTARFEILGEADSAVPGAQGNVERFFLLRQKPVG